MPGDLPDDLLRCPGHVAEAVALWGGREPSAELLAGWPGRCALCLGARGSGAGTLVSPEGLHPCPPCGGWHFLHLGCASAGGLLPGEASLSRPSRLLSPAALAPLAACPDALLAAEAAMGEDLRLPGRLAAESHEGWRDVAPPWEPEELAEP